MVNYIEKSDNKCTKNIQNIGQGVNPSPLNQETIGVGPTIFPNCKVEIDHLP